MDGAPQSLAEYFDGWYADMAASSVKDEIAQRHLGLPQHLLSTSLVGWQGVEEVITALDLSPDDTLLDLACGRGGYGLEIARRTRSQLVGIDFSAEAIRQAAEQARRLGRTADFRVGDLAATGLADHSVDAVLCVDAIQFADSHGDVYYELLRVLAPGGRVVLTCWEPVDRDDEQVPPRLRKVDLHQGLTASGFVGVDVRERPDWRAMERAMWQETAALNPRGDRALTAFHDEGVWALERFDSLRRVLAMAAAPTTG